MIEKIVQHILLNLTVTGNFETTGFDPLLILWAMYVKSILRKKKCFLLFFPLNLFFSCRGLSSCILLSSLCPAALPHAGHPFPAALDVYLTFDVVAACPGAQGPIKTLPPPIPASPRTLSFCLLRSSFVHIFTFFPSHLCPGAPPAVCTAPLSLPSYYTNVTGHKTGLLRALCLAWAQLALLFYTVSFLRR